MSARESRKSSGVPTVISWTFESVCIWVSFTSVDDHHCSRYDRHAERRTRMAMRERGRETEATDLGTRLREVRVLRGKSLSAVARAAAISTAYLQKLEAGGVKQPSPKV